MSRLDKHKAQHKAAMSRKKVQSNPLEDIMRPSEAEIDLDSPEPPLPKMIPDPSAPPLPPIPGSPEDMAKKVVDPLIESLKEKLKTVDVSQFKRPQNSPAVRDERMRRKGRFPHETRVVTKYDATKEKWTAEAEVPDVNGREGPMLTTRGPGIHGCIESLWDQYCRWRDEQTEAAK